MNILKLVLSVVEPNGAMLGRAMDKREVCIGAKWIRVEEIKGASGIGWNTHDVMVEIVVVVKESEISSRSRCNAKKCEEKRRKGR